MASQSLEVFSSQQHDRFDQEKALCRSYGRQNLYNFPKQHFSNSRLCNKWGLGLRIPENKIKHWITALFLNVQVPEQWRSNFVSSTNIQLNTTVSTYCDSFYSGTYYHWSSQSWHLTFLPLSRKNKSNWNRQYLEVCFPSRKLVILSWHLYCKLVYFFYKSFHHFNII